jgi:rod shape-determining protein MreB
MDVGIDLGTANILITLGDKIIVKEPSVVAFDRKKNEIIATGDEAYKMLGRTPDYISVVRPLKDGIIDDHDLTMKLIREFVQKASKNLMIKPQIIICVPSSVTGVENRAVIEAALSAGARKVYLIKEPIAALIGSGADITKANGLMVVDVGGGTSDVAVVSFNGIVASSTLKMAGNKFDNAIIKYFVQRDKILIGEKSAEAAKKEIGCVFNPNPDNTMTVKGRHLIQGLPKAIEVSEVEMCEALLPCAMEIVGQIKAILETAPPELVGDILTSGIVLTGGGAMLNGLAELISHHVNTPCRLADNPLECVARGTAAAFKVAEQLMDGFEQISVYKNK